MQQLLKEMDQLKLEEKTEKPKRVGVLSDKRTLEHCSSKPHPQCPQRVISIMENFKKKGLLQHKLIENVDTIEPIDLNHVANIHGQDYTEFVKHVWPEEQTRRKQILLNVDTYINKHTLCAAQIAANAVIMSVDKIVNGEWASAFAAVRPPGHHSGMVSQPSGFCIFNNVAVGAKYALKHYKRILIVDWDAHHGEGTQNLFYNSPQVMYVSIHRFDEQTFYPHVKQSGPSFVGQGKAAGKNINIAWNILTQEEAKARKPIKQTCGNSEYIYAFQRILLPIFRQFNPQLIFISAGFDSACGDPLAGLSLTEIGYTYMTRQLKKINSKIVAVLEGGYNLQSISWASEAVLKELLNQTDQDKQEKLGELLKSYQVNKIGLSAVADTKIYISQHWKCLESPEPNNLESSKMLAKETQSQKQPSLKEHSSTTETNNLVNQFKQFKLTDKMSTASEPTPNIEQQFVAEKTEGVDKMKKKEPMKQPTKEEYKGPMTRARAKKAEHKQEK